jgi:glycosyltransferase involved in cell wall biosynthesis
MRADLLMFETKYDVEFFRALGPRRVAWFSNNRPLPPVRKEVFGDRAKKLVYLGWVTEDKGIGLLIEAVSRIEGDVRVDIYGNDLMNVEAMLPPNGAVRYRGPIDNESVYETLLGYDALVLPSYRRNEGYPGAIIEAFLVGLPVIASRLPGISEIVIDGETGCLVEPRSVDELRKAILRLNEDRDFYKKLTSRVREHSFGFSSEYWHENFVNEIGDLVARRRRPSAR